MKIFILSSLLLLFMVSLRAQPPGYAEVEFRHLLSSERAPCYIETSVIDEARLAELRQNPHCKAMTDDLDVDLARESLIRYVIGGDCHMRLAIRAFRVDAERKVKVIFNNIYGGCRAGGGKAGWFTLEKPPKGYEIELVKVLVDRIHGPDANGFQFGPPFSRFGIQTLEARAIDLRGCIQTIRKKQFVIDGREAYLAAIRNDAGRDRCLKDIEPIDLENNTLVGIELNSGYCRTPIGLEYKVKKLVDSKEFLVDVSWEDPRGSICRALSQYDLWLLVPKLPEGYQVRFATGPRVDHGKTDN